MSENNVNLVEDVNEVTQPVVKHKKKMNHTVHLALFLAVLGVICAGLLALVNMITTPFIEANLQKELEKTLEVIKVKEPTQLDVELIDGVEAVYEGIVNKGEVTEAPCYVIQTKVKNNYTTVTTLIVINKDNGSIITVKPIGSGLTTHNKDADLIASDFGVIGATSSDYLSKFQPVADATVSSGSISEGIKLAYEQLKGMGA